MVAPMQTVAPVTEITGSGFTTTFTVAVLTQEFASVTVSEYVPPLPVVAPLIVGFCCVEVKDEGPLHA
jgi:hypothetical protein